MNTWEKEKKEKITQINGHGDGGDGGSTENPGDQEPVISAEGKIIIGEAEWDANTHTASVTLNKISEVDENLQVQYQINGTSEEKWVIGETATGIQHGQTIYARFWNGTKGGTYIEKKIIDGISPGVLVSITGTGTNTITAVVEAGDNQSGLPSSPTYTFSIKEKNNSDSTYRTEQSNSSTTCQFTNLKQNTEYTIKVTVQDKAGNKGEATVDGRTETVVASTGNINASAPTWDANTHTASIILTKGTGIDASLKIQYQINGYEEGKWTEGTTVTGIQHNDVVYARLWDGTNGGSEASVTIKDGIEPNIATITLGATSAKTGANVTAEVTHNDAQSGIKIESCKWVYNTTSTEIGTTASSYTGGIFESNGQTINLSANSAGIYYLHVLSTDNGGNTKETISNGITIYSSDKTPPVLTDPIATVDGLTFKISISGSDSQSGLKQITYQTYDAKVSPASGIVDADGMASFVATEEGKYYVRFEAEDNEGNTSWKGITVEVFESISVEEAKSLINETNIRDYMGTRVDYNPPNGGVWRVFYYDGEEGKYGVPNTVYLRVDSGVSGWKSSSVKDFDNWELRTGWPGAGGLTFTSRMHPSWRTSGGWRLWFEHNWKKTVYLLLRWSYLV